MEDLSEGPLSRLRVLYVSDLTPEYYGEYRQRALNRVRLGHLAALDYIPLVATPGLAGQTSIPTTGWSGRCAPEPCRTAGCRA